MKPELHALVADVVTALDYELWGCEYQPHGRSACLVVYIDSPQGITLDDCQKVSQQLSAVLDVEEPIKGEYTLEVSSPGVERPLYTAAQFGRYIGEMVQIRLFNPLDGRRQWVGELQSVEEDSVTLLVDGQTQTITMANMSKANLRSSQS